MSEDNETQPSYLHIWKQTILELDDPPSALKLLLESSFFPLCKLYHFFIASKKLALWEITRFLRNSK